MNRPTGLIFGKYTKDFLFWRVTWQTIGWEYDNLITTKDIVIDIKFKGVKSNNKVKAISKKLINITNSIKKEMRP